MINTFGKFTGVFLASSLLAADILQAAALEEIVVTAQKRAENLQDVPITITALSADRLETSGFNNISDLAMMSPFGNRICESPIMFENSSHPSSSNTIAR